MVLYESMAGSWFTPCEVRGCSLPAKCGFLEQDAAPVNPDSVDDPPVGGRREAEGSENLFPTHRVWCRWRTGRKKDSFSR